jgi:hypothetical protein
MISSLQFRIHEVLMDSGLEIGRSKIRWWMWLWIAWSKSLKIFVLITVCPRIPLLVTFFSHGGGSILVYKLCKDFSLYRSRIHECTISLMFRGVSWDFSDLGFPYTVFTLKTSFKLHFLKEGRELSLDFCPNYVKEFGLWTGHSLLSGQIVIPRTHPTTIVQNCTQIYSRS